MATSRGKLTRPRKCLLFGPVGIGKSTCAKDCYVFDFEGSTYDIDLHRDDLKGCDYNGFVSRLGEIMDEDIQEPTIAFDTVDWLEKIIVADVKRTTTDEQRAYGNEKKLIEEKWAYLCRGFEKLIADKGKNLLFIAHEKLEKVSPSDAASYQQYAPDLQCDLISEWCDEILYLRYRIVTTEQKEGFGKVRQVAIPTRLRFIQTTRTPGAVAKNRLGLPDELESWEQYRGFLAK